MQLIMWVVKSGFPFVSTNRFNAPPTLVDIDGDGDIEILAGNDSGLLHILHHDGSEMASFNTGDDIRGGISVSDLNDDGFYEVLFTGMMISFIFGTQLQDKSWKDGLLT